jgi:hypothetical protein
VERYITISPVGGCQRKRSRRSYKKPGGGGGEELPLHTQFFSVPSAPLDLFRGGVERSKYLAFWKGICPFLSYATLFEREALIGDGVRNRCLATPMSAELVGISKVLSM